MLARLLPSTVLQCLLFAAATSAQYTIDSLSFGNKGSLSQTGIPGWKLSGEGHDPQILSDRIILTPPAPGSTRGSLWAEAGTAKAYWSAELSFRATGQERGSGNLGIWFVHDGQRAVGQSSVYTIGQFDGLALVIDQYSGRGGSIRGFLNDGTKSYKDHHNVDGLAFGHCDYAYRNLGRPSRVRVTNDAHGFSVEVDDTPCFSSHKVSLPAGYHFGISAATAENPDSFEVNHFVVSTTNAITREEPQKDKRPVLQRPDHLSKGETSESPDSAAAAFNNADHAANSNAGSAQVSDTQLADLNSRLQSISSQLASVLAEVARVTRAQDTQYSELLAAVSKQQPAAMGNDAALLTALSRRVEGIERTVQTIQRDVEGRDYKEHLSDLKQAVEGVRGGLADGLPDTLSKIVSTSAPRMGMYVFVVVAVQVMLLGAYLVYKKRRDGAPKKYL